MNDNYRGTPGSGNNFCYNCRTPLEANTHFCPVCGARVISQAEIITRTASPAAGKPSTDKKLIAILAIVIAVAVTGSAAGLTWLLRANKPDDKIDKTTTEYASDRPLSTPDLNEVSLTALPEDLIYDPSIHISCLVEAPQIIIPANYRSLDYLVYIQCWTNQNQSEILVNVEIPGYTQKFEQKITIGRSETEIAVHPPLVENITELLHSSKDAQINISVKNLDNGEMVVQDSRPVRLYSRYDMQWQSDEGVPYYENILAWLTPEAPEVKQLLRLSVDSAAELWPGQLTSIVGYQPVGSWSEIDITYAQVAAMMHALASRLQVKYVMAPFSSTGSELQRIATPAQVINDSSGLCAETAVTIASAIQATDMHAVLLLLPGHMQAAVETWYGSGEYLLIETTALDSAASGNFLDVITYLTPEEWEAYLDQDGYVAIDCELAESLNIRPID